MIRETQVAIALRRLFGRLPVLSFLGYVSPLTDAEARLVAFRMRHPSSFDQLIRAGEIMDQAEPLTEEDMRAVRSVDPVGFLPAAAQAAIMRAKQP